MGDGTIGGGGSGVGLLRNNEREEAKKRSNEKMELEGIHDELGGNFQMGFVQKQYLYIGTGQNWMEEGEEVCVGS